MPWQCRATFTGHRGAIYALAPDPRATFFLSAGGDGQVVRWDIERPDRGELLATVDRPVFALLHDPERRLLLIGKDDGAMHVLDLGTGRELHLFTVHRKGIFCMRTLPGDRFACAGGDGSISIWRADPVELVRQIPVCEEKMRDLSVSPDGRWLAAADSGGFLRLFDTEDLNEHQRVHAHDGGCTAVVFHPTKPVLISGGKDGRLKSWSAGGLHAVLDLPAHEGSVYSICFNGKGAIGATASRDKTVKLWDPGTLDPIQRLDRTAGGHSRSVNTLLWVGPMLASGGDDRTIALWEDPG